MNGSDSNTSGGTVVSLGYKPQASGDTISDRQMRELVRRLMGSIDLGATSDIYDGPTAPDDHTLIWWPKDPTSGVRIGQPKTYSVDTGTWITLGTGAQLPQFRQHRSGFIFFENAGGSAANLSKNVGFASVGGENYDVALTPIARNDTGGIAAPGGMANFALLITNIADGQFTVMAYQVPAGGIGALWSVTEINPDKV